MQFTQGRILAITVIGLLFATVAVRDADAHIHKLKAKKLAKLAILAKALHPKLIPIIPFHITKHTKVPVHYPVYYPIHAHTGYKHVILPSQHHGHGHYGGSLGGAHFLGGGYGDFGGGHGWDLGGHGWW